MKSNALTVSPIQAFDAVSKNRIRSFGHVHLCGALHVCWQTRDKVEGQYMVAMLYRDVLCFASVGRFDQIYTIQICMSRADLKVAEADGGRGLQCHGAPFTWKLLFECDYQLYEVIVTASSAKEELEWRTRLEQPAKQQQSLDDRDPDTNSSLAINMKSLGAVFGKPGEFCIRR
jgi:hypothetical protein